MRDSIDLLGIGLGPFNLSLAALLDKLPQFTSLFFERKAAFDWHPELMFPDSTMQTSYFKDLVTPIDPTSPYSFLNYLVQHDQFYPFLNTQRTVISRREFELYCTWVSQQLSEKLRFNTTARAVSFTGAHFSIQTDSETYQARNICVATGMRPWVPEFAQPLLGPKVFHAKSPELREANLSGKSVLIVGGGQTGLEVFRNALKAKWGHVHSLCLITRRKGLEPLDESAFTNDFFTPRYVESFWNLSPETKSKTVQSQKLASDGNTPKYLHDLYVDLYQTKYVERDTRDIRILACRQMSNLQKVGDQYRATVVNTQLQRQEELSAEIVILCTGFENYIPPALEPLFQRIPLDERGRFQFSKSYAIHWDGPAENRIYAQNMSRHAHGIVDPQTSLMAWRSAVIVNDLVDKPIYRTTATHKNFVEYD